MMGKSWGYGGMMIYEAKMKNNWLVVLTILKNMKVNGKDDIPYMKWKIKFMFETTNQHNNVEY
jgi:hypothetical protein